MNSSRYTLILTAVLSALFIYLQLAEYDFDRTRFILAGDFFVNSQNVPGGIHVFSNSAGYDGQFYYRLALNPFTSQKLEYGIELDDPPWRQRRIFYPLLAWLLSFGNSQMVSWMLIIINFAGLCVIGWIGGKFAKGAGLHALWGMTFPLYGGFVMTLSRDLGEIVEVALILVSFYFLRRGRHIYATLFLTLAVFTKEPSLLIAWGALIVLLMRAKWAQDELRWYFPVIPGISHIIWHIWLYYRWDVSLSSDIFDKLSFPFAGIFKLLIKNSPFSGYPNYICFTELVIILLFMLGVFISFRTSRSNLTEKITWFHYFVLVICLVDRHYWITDGEFLRAMSEFHVIGLMILMNSRVWFRKPIFLLNMLLCIYLAVMVIYYPDIPRYSIGERVSDKIEEVQEGKQIRLNLRLDPLQSRYREGERVILRIDIFVPDRKQLKTDIYLVMLHPSNRLYFSPSWTLRSSPMIRNFSLPRGESKENAPLIEFTIGEDGPPIDVDGIYTFAIGATKPGTLHYISNVSTLTFVVAP